MSAEKIDYDKLKSIYDYTDKEHSNKLIQDRFWNEISKEMETSDHLRLRLIESGWNDQLNQLIQNAIIKRTDNGQAADTIKFEQLYKDVIDIARDAITEELENEFHQKISEYLSLNPQEESSSSIPSPDSADVPMEVSSDVSSNVTSDIPSNIIISDIPSDVLSSDDSLMEAECSYNH